MRLLSGQPGEQARVALRFVTVGTESGDRFLVSDLVLAEAYYAFQHHYGASKGNILEALRALLAAPGIEGSGEAAGILATPGLERAKPGFLDRVILNEYLHSGAAQMLTFERAASKLQGCGYFCTNPLCDRHRANHHRDL